MALRTFTDSSGREWMAWDVSPPKIYSPVRARVDRRATAAARTGPERRSGAERRRRPLPPEIAYGWICFQSEEEKRRLAPPPPGWPDRSDAELERLCSQARRNARAS